MSVTEQEVAELVTDLHDQELISDQIVDRARGHLERGDKGAALHVVVDQGLRAERDEVGR